MQSIELITKDETKALVIKDYAGIFQFSKVMGPAYQKIMAYMKSQGEEPKKAPFTQYSIDDWESATNMKGLKSIFNLLIKKWNIKMGFESSVQINGINEIENCIIPKGDYLKTHHIGPYQKVGNAYKKLYAFAKEKNYTLGNVCYEYYLNSPKEVSKDKLETEILVPIIN